MITDTAFVQTAVSVAFRAGKVGKWKRNTSWKHHLQQPRCSCQSNEQQLSELTSTVQLQLLRCLLELLSKNESKTVALHTGVLHEPENRAITLIFEGV